VVPANPRTSQVKLNIWTLSQYFIFQRFYERTAVFLTSRSSAWAPDLTVNVIADPGEQICLTGTPYIRWLFKDA
jgi:hypothetical protein